MDSPLDPLIAIVHSSSTDSWKERNEEALNSLFGTRYHSNARRTVALRARDIRGGADNIPFAAVIHPNNTDSGAYGGTSFVLFPAENSSCLVTMCVGTQGLAPDEAILGRPGHARKLQAITAWLNQKFSQGEPVAWSKSDPTRTDINIPDQIRQRWKIYERAFAKYGRYLYAVYCPNEDRTATETACKAMLDVLFEERGYDKPLTAHQDDAEAIRTSWMAHLMPQTTESQVVDLLRNRRFVILQGPPGTGKTRVANRILQNHYQGFGRSIQFHPNTTYENFIGGLAPVTRTQQDGTGIGFAFAPKPGFLCEAAAAAAQDPSRPYLLHIDEINRADLGKVLGEAIYLLEPDEDTPRDIDLAYDYGPPIGTRLSLPPNLHILGTMNSSDRSIAILDIAVRRRFAFVSLWPSVDVVRTNSHSLGAEAFQTLLNIFIEYAPEEALSLVPGHSYFLASDESAVRTKLKTGLAPLLTEYLAQGYVAGFAEPIRTYLQELEGL